MTGGQSFAKKWAANNMADGLYKVIAYTFLIIFAFCCLFPFYIVVLNSFTAERSIVAHGYNVIPSDLTLDAYKYMFRGPQLLNSYKVTLTVVSVGTLLSTITTAMLAYVIAHPKVQIRNILAFLLYFAMLFGTPLVGFYMLVVNVLQIKNTLWALVLPYLVNPFYAFILVAAFRDFPHEISESAAIDGATDIRIFFRIVLPITLPSIMTIALFFALMYWNDWWLSLLFVDKSNMHSLQMMIRQLISNINASRYVGGTEMLNIAIPTDSIKMAVVCVTIGPILIVYPFIQRFFVKGISLGAVKG